MNNKEDNNKGALKRKRKRVIKNGSPKITQKRPTREIRLNRFIANAGVCSRREADSLISDGLIKVNGEVSAVLGTKVKGTDVVEYNGKKLSIIEQAYVLLNKPKDFITTTSDPQGRRTVMDLIKNVDSDRVYPVGRLDRNTTGILIFTNDGMLAQHLTHPKNNIEKIYSIELDKPLTEAYRNLLLKGVKLEDGLMKADKLAFIEGNKQKLGMEIHSGKNRVIRRMFEALDYEVVKLDRVVFAGIDKAGLKRGDWRHLTDKEVAELKKNIKKV